MRLQYRTEVYQAGKKNKGGAAYNIVSLNYETNKDGEKLRQVDDDAKVRALMRSKNLDSKNNSGFNVLTGEMRPSVQVPTHDKYNPNPLARAGGSMLSNVPSSVRSQRSVASGILPGMN